MTNLALLGIVLLLIAGFFLFLLAVGLRVFNTVPTTTPTPSMTATQTPTASPTNTATLTNTTTLSPTPTQSATVEQPKITLSVTPQTGGG